MTKTIHDLVRAWCEKGRRDFITAKTHTMTQRRSSLILSVFTRSNHLRNI